MKREMEGLSKANEKKQQPKFEDLFEPTVEEEEEMGEELCPGRPKLKRPSPGNSRRASAGAVVSEDFDQGMDFRCSERSLVLRREGSRLMGAGNSNGPTGFDPMDTMVKFIGGGVECHGEVKTMMWWT